MADYRNYAPLVRPGGIIAFHDLGNEWPDVRKVWDKVPKTTSAPRSLLRLQPATGLGCSMYKGPYHILTPFSRFQNLVAFSKHLRSFKEVPLIWHPILDDDLPFTLDGAVVVNDFRIEEWIIRPVRTLAKVEGWYPVYTKQNHFADHYPLNEEELRHRFVLLNDDDFVRRDFFEKLDAVDGNVLITSMERGTPVMPKYQPFLKASPENVQYR